MGMLFFGRNRSGREGDSRAPFAERESIQVVYRGRYYSGQVKGIQADGLWVTWTSIGGSAPRPAEAETITLFSSERTEGEGFHARIMESTDGGLSLLKIVSRADVGVVHRRKHVRVPYQFPVRFRLLNVSTPGRRWVETHAQDLSGGGVRIYVHRWDLPPSGSRLELELEIPKSAPIRAKAEVAWTGPAGSSATYFEMGLRFVEIGGADRDLIFRRVFERQVELHRSGLI